jgi:hypothetical protein
MFTVQSSGATPVAVETVAEVFALLNDLKHYGLSTTELTVLRDGAHPVELVRHGYMSPHFGMRLGGDPLQTLLTMLNEVDHYARRGNTVRKPWQMLRLQWGALTAVGSLSYGVFPGFTQRVAGQHFRHTLPDGGVVEGQLYECIGAEFRARYGFGTNGPAYGNGSDINSRHEIHLAYALALGKAVPQDVIGDALRMTEHFWDPVMLVPLLERPFLRGQFSPNRLEQVLAIYERNGKRHITADNVEAIASAVVGLGIDASYTEVDDALFLAGLLPMEPTALAAPPAAAQPLNELASKLAAQLHSDVAAKRIAFLDQQRQTGQISLREHARRTTVEKTYGPSTFQSHANKMVQALQQRDVGPLLAFLDTSEDMNRTSKRFAKEHFGLNTMRMRAAERRAAVFRYCGLDAVGQAAWDARRQEARATAKVSPVPAELAAA